MCFFILLAIVAGTYAGLRTRYNDTSTYIYGYNLLSPNGALLDGMDWSLGENPGFWAVSRILRHAGATSQDFLMIFALVTIAIYVWFLRKYTTNISFGVFLLMFVGGYALVFAAIKQCFAIALCLIATDRYLEGKRGMFVLWILLAMTFHPYSFMYLFVPFLTSNPWTKRTYIIIGLTLLVGAFF
ncbi:MAG: EpsG family protein, partial [Eggerthellaceae bacterium]